MASRARRKQPERQPIKRSGLTAAARRIRLEDGKTAKRQAAKTQEWQQTAWSYFRTVPEIRHGVWFRANALAKLRLFGATRPPEADSDDEPLPVGDEEAALPEEFAAAVEAELDRLRSPLGGQPAIIRRLSMNFDVPGECYLVGRGARDDEPEEWTIRSISEVDVTNQGTYKVKATPSDSKGTPLDPEQDTAIRLWEPDAEWSDRATSPMEALLEECEALLVLSRQVKAEARSRIPAGLLYVHNDLSFGNEDTTQPEQGDDTEDPFLLALEEALIEPVEDDGSPGQVAPAVLRGKVPANEAIARIEIGRQSDATLDARIKARVDRLARGMNMPVEHMMGHQQTTFANAAQVDADLFEKYLEPSAVTICDMLTFAYLRPNLLDAGHDPALVERVMVWFDPAPLIAQPDTEKNAPQAHRMGLISDAAGRRALGFDEADAPTAEELLIRRGLTGITTAAIVTALLQALADEAGVELPSPQEAEDSEAGGVGDQVAAALTLVPARPPEPPTTVTAAAVTRSDLGRRLTEMDRELRGRLLALADTALERALERAGNRLSNKARSHRAELKSIPPERRAAHLGRSLLADAGVDPEDLLAGAFDELEQDFLTLGDATQQAVVSALAAALGLSDVEVDVLRQRQADDLASAWAWMEAELAALAATRLFDPSPAADTLGELDVTVSVPPGLVRQAVARAGGAAGLETSGAGDAWLVLTDAGTRPAGGIGTGQVAREVMLAHGAMVEAYRWQYGPALRTRPFEPHSHLDGRVFENFDDPALLNTSGFPSVSHYMPGDHKGCMCDVEPIVLVPQLEEAA